MSSSPFPDTRIPLIIVTGFLGSGKTSFVNHILASLTNKKVVVIENEFAELGIDSRIIKKSKDSKIFELNNGCICCSMNGELEGVFAEIVKNKEHWDYVIIETTGVADPSPIISNFFSNPLLCEEFRLDCMYTLVDCKNFFKQIQREYETKKQIAFANKILLNKIDLVEEEEKEKIKKEISKLNPDSQISETTHAKIPLQHIFEESAFDISDLKKIKNSFQSFSFSPSLAPSVLTKPVQSHDIQSFGISSEGEILLPEFDFFIRTLIELKRNDLYRTKGIVNLKGANQPLIFQGIHDAIEWFPGPPWGEDEKRETKMIFIGKNLDKQDIETAFKKILH
ncbi:GTP-binding protein [Candidatus Woesearchaeota archaeon]|nr:GTP-binding protein [Nanoarchaeota archaeon]MCB9370432.1 GTP-binding protein [Candidatus Woesearchaeota archaeon]USN43510.1 MAG: GTP-binding protein [Candidatus Woesearchaeota archaeon]